MSVERLSAHGEGGEGKGRAAGRMEDSLGQERGRRDHTRLGGRATLWVIYRARALLLSVSWVTATDYCATSPLCATKSWTYPSIFCRYGYTKSRFASCTVYS